MLLFDVCLTSVCLSRTLGLTREQRGQTKIGTEVAHVTRDWHHFQGQKVKRSKVADVLNSQHAGTGATWRINAQILSTCMGRRHIVSPRAQLIKVGSSSTDAQFCVICHFRKCYQFLINCPQKGERSYIVHRNKMCSR